MTYRGEHRQLSIRLYQRLVPPRQPDLVGRLHGSFQKLFRGHGGEGGDLVLRQEAAVEMACSNVTPRQLFCAESRLSKQMERKMKAYQRLSTWIPSLETVSLTCWAVADLPVPPTYHHPQNESASVRLSIKFPQPPSHWVTQIRRELQTHRSVPRRSPCSS
jgi:hypothetical protein